MNNQQRIEAAMWKVDDRAGDLIKHALSMNGEVEYAWKVRDLLKYARHYADAMRALARASRTRK